MISAYSNDLCAEQAVLGCILLDNNSFSEIDSYLLENDFSSYDHQKIFEAIKTLISSGKKADIICVAEFINKKDTALFIQLCDIAQSHFVVSNIKFYADFIKKSSSERKIVSAAQEIIKFVRDQKENCLDHALQLFNNISDGITSNSITPASKIITDVLDIIDKRHANPNEIDGLSSGFKELDKLLQGLHSNDLIIVAGRPSMGKTLFAMNIAEHAALKEQHSVIVFSLEMSKEQLLQRSLSSVSSVSANQTKTGTLNPHDFQKIANVVPLYQSSKFFIDDRASLSVSDIRSRCRQIKREHGLSLIVIDYISLMTGEGENETLRISNISRGLKLLARDLSVPIIAISQLNRSVEQRNNKRPTMSDLRQSGAIEQDADVIVFIYRDEVYNVNSSFKGIAEIIIAKHRNGELGTINLKFNSDYCRFDDCNIQIKNEQTYPNKWQGHSFEYRGEL